MEIGLKAFIQIADFLQQQKESKEQQTPTMPATFSTPQNEILSVYLNNQLNAVNKRTGGQVGKENENEPQTPLRVMLTDSLARDIGLYNYFEPVRRAFQVIYQMKSKFLLIKPVNVFIY
jgi:hypothetical protein